MDEFFARATIHVGGRPVGRPKSEASKKGVSLRLSPRVPDDFRSTEPGWQTRINAVLEREVSRQRKKA